MSRFSLNPSANKTTIRPSRRRPTHENIASLGASLDSADWSSVYNTADVEESFNNFSDVFSLHLDNHIPKVKDKQINYKSSPRLPWITESILRSINRKNNVL